ncbi:hypothetical protein [Sunxiuqinia dokdonensis]|nr:hypothetical protein [Sunxiuqinia dokdonensis]
METEFSPIPPDYYDMFLEEQKKEFSKVFYFVTGNDVEEAKGKITGLVKSDGFKKYLTFDSGDKVRVDRIITVNGIPGPAYDEYDSYALACLNCNVQAD